MVMCVVFFPTECLKKLCFFGEIENVWFPFLLELPILLAIEQVIFVIYIIY